MSDPIASTTLFSTAFPTSSGFPAIGDVSSFFTTVVPSASFATSTPVVSASSAGSPVLDDESLAALVAQAADLVGRLGLALGALEIGLVLAGITFGVMITRASSFLRKNPSASVWVKGTVASLVFFNTFQLIATVHAAYVAAVPAIGDVYARMASSQWSIMIQLGVMTIAAAIAQLFFVVRLYTAKRMIFLAGAVTLMGVEIVFSWIAVWLMFEQGYTKILIDNWENKWATIATFCVAAVVNALIAACAFGAMQQPQAQRRSSFLTFKGFLFCAALSSLAAILAATMLVSMVWLDITFCLGNLYTIAVLLSLTSGAAPATSALPSFSTPTDQRASVATLSTEDKAIWQDIVKAQMSKATEASLHRDAELEVPPPPQYIPNEKAQFSLGYHTHTSAV